MSCRQRGSGRRLSHTRGGGCGCGHTEESDTGTDMEALEQLQRDLEQEVADVAARLKRLKEQQQARVDA